MNFITMTGNICNDLELKTTSGGKNVCSFNLAVKRPFAKDVTDFITIVAWNKRAEILTKYCGKGTKIGVQGVLTSRKWQDADGKNRVAFEVIANEIEFLDKKADGQSAEPSISTTSGDIVPTDDFVVLDPGDDLPF